MVLDGHLNRPPSDVFNRHVHSHLRFWRSWSSGRIHVFFDHFIETGLVKSHSKPDDVAPVTTAPYFLTIRYTFSVLSFVKKKKMEKD